MHYKLIVPGAQDFGASVSQLVKISQRGLVGEDLLAFTKRASHQFVDSIRGMTLHPGDVPIHLIAVGADEWFGANRNGDTFDEATLRSQHPTFVKHARFFRDHLNKDHSKSYGIVKFSGYNERMHRAELIAVLNGTKEAARRNGGLLADLELEKLARNETIPVSMACRVPYDVCSGCSNKARTRAEYCTADTCKYGGLKHNITKVASNGHVLRAFNPGCDFIDISHVDRNADRTAYVLGHAKAASGLVKSGSQLGEEAGLRTPFWIAAEHALPVVAATLKTAFTLADVEEDIRRNPASQVVNSTRALDSSLQTPMDDRGPFAKSGRDREQAINALAGHGVCLPVREFLFLHLGDREKAASVADAVSRRLPGVYTRMVAEEDLERVVASNPYLTSGSISATAETANRWAMKYAADYSLSPSCIDKRAVRSAVMNRSIPEFRPVDHTPADSQSENLARQYALYKLGFLGHWQGAADFERLCNLAVRQNYIG